MADKLLTFHGPSHLLEVPGFFTIARGQSHPIDEHLAEAVVAANPRLSLTITDLNENAKRRSSATSQPEAETGEGQPAPNDQKE